MKSIWAIRGANEKLTERETRQRDAMANGDEADLMDYAEYCGPWPQQHMPIEYFYPSTWGHTRRPVTLREDCLLTQVSLHVTGPMTVPMVPTAGRPSQPPIPMPVQVPVGHVVHQIMDESGQLRHVFLSTQRPHGPHEGQVNK